MNYVRFYQRDHTIKPATKYPNVCHSGESRNPDEFLDAPGLEPA